MYIELSRNTPLLVQLFFINDQDDKSDIDGAMVREVLDVILNLAAQGNTMVIVTHEMQFARAVADRVVFLDDGKIIEEEPPEIFFRNPKTERAKRFLSTFTFHTVKR